VSAWSLARRAVRCRVADGRIGGAAGRNRAATDRVGRGLATVCEGHVCMHASWMDEVGER
jgi:hypothetical protein